MARTARKPRIEEQPEEPAAPEMAAADEQDNTDDRADLHAIATESLTGLVGKLQRLADDQVNAKVLIENRWYEDIRQYHGRYPANTELALKGSDKSKLFVRATRTQVSSWEARLGDLLFPTEDRNWGIAPTPVPELSSAMKRAADTMPDAVQKANELQQQGQGEQAQAVADTANAVMEETKKLEKEMKQARSAAELMEAQIEDQLEEGLYNIRSRECLHDMVKLGTAVMKGPVLTGRTRRSWKKDDSAAQPGSASVYKLDLQRDGRPEYTRVNPWNFYPDMSARTPDESEFSFELHLWNDKDLRGSVKKLGLNAEKVIELLREKPKQPLPQYWQILREITSNAQATIEGRYQVWEYHGSLEYEDLATIAAATGETQLLQMVKDNPLAEAAVVIWFCQGKLLKFGPHPLDSCESLYSVVPFERDETSMFGFGVPYLMRDSQAALNAAWRMMMDNGALSVGPQIVIDQDAITPTDGEDWTLKPLKVWLTSTTSLTKLPEGYKPFQVFHVDSRLDQLVSIIELAQKFIEDESNMPKVAMGDQGNHIQTAQGMSMLMNSANVVFRRVVKNVDDFLTVPNIRRIYDWNMQHSPREEIKGDYEVQARGSSVLLVRELQSQNLMGMLEKFGAHPVLGPLFIWPEIARKLCQSQMLHADELVKSDEVIDQEAKARAAAAAQMQQGAAKSAADPAALKNAIDIANINAKNRMDVAELQHETAMMTLAQTHNMTLDELSAKLRINHENIQHKERVIATEAALTPPDTTVGQAMSGSGAAALA